MVQRGDAILIGLLTFSIAVIATSILVPIARRLALRVGVLDVPNERSSHSVPTPRTGGLGILGGILVGLVIAFLAGRPSPSSGEWWLLGLLGLGSLVGFLDDWKDLPTGIRMPAYLIIATGVCFAFLRIESIDIPGLPVVEVGMVLGLVFSALFVAWYTNLFNFMDGIDGIAGGAATVCLGSLGIVFAQNGQTVLACLALSAAGASIGFLFHNYPPASVFMGDGGSVFLGMAAGALSLAAVAKGVLSLAAAVLLLLPFVFDATFTLFRRMVRRERFWAAHRTHIYQQMCDLGLSHRAVTTIYTSAAVGFAALGLVFDGLPAAAQIISWWSSLAVLLALSSVVLVKRKRMNSK